MNRLLWALSAVLLMVLAFSPTLALAVGGTEASPFYTVTDCKATEAAPTYTEGQMVPCSTDLRGNLRQTPGTYQSGEIPNASQALSGMATSGMVVRSKHLMTAVTTNTTSATTDLPIGDKTFTAKVAGTGAVTATITILGTNTNAAANGMLICTITLSGTTQDQYACPSVKTNFLYWYATSANVTGTSATVEVDGNF